MGISRDFHSASTVSGGILASCERTARTGAIAEGVGRAVFSHGAGSTEQAKNPRQSRVFRQQADSSLVLLFVSVVVAVDIIYRYVFFFEYTVA